MASTERPQRSTWTIQTTITTKDCHHRLPLVSSFGSAVSLAFSFGPSSGIVVPSRSRRRRPKARRARRSYAAISVRISRRGVHAARFRRQSEAEACSGVSQQRRLPPSAIHLEVNEAESAGLPNLSPLSQLFREVKCGRERRCVVFGPVRCPGHHNFGAGAPKRSETLHELNVRRLHTEVADKEHARHREVRMDGRVGDGVRQGTKVLSCLLYQP